MPFQNFIPGPFTLFSNYVIVLLHHFLILNLAVLPHFVSMSFYAISLVLSPYFLFMHLLYTIYKFYLWPCYHVSFFFPFISFSKYVLPNLFFILFLALVPYLLISPVFRHVAEQGDAVSVFDIYLSDLEYADDVTLVDEDEKKATKELELLIFQFQTMKINADR